MWLSISRPRTLLYISTIGFLCDTLHHICVAPGVYSGRICFILAHFGSLLVCEKKSWAWTSKVKTKLTGFNLCSWLSFNTNNHMLSNVDIVGCGIIKSLPVCVALRATPLNPNARKGMGESNLHLAFHVVYSFVVLIVFVKRSAMEH